ncbi:superoxide dismutase family protein [Faecalispora anaeroviscerum]|uniref:superoxide dismutase family protein n=1 Tax=Faecalispora anaeroviscerum TaxID=2991836 RepID=UPI0024B9614E|nr:superoxide dismutase family protein [Faecalispora anaeroviscerum]
MLDFNTLQNTGRRTPDAHAVIKGSAAYPELCGTVRLHQMADGVLVSALIHGLPQGKGSCPVNVFGFHIHEGKACTGNDKDPFADSGGHFNPGNCPHPAHAGDMPPLFGNQGTAYLSFFTDRFTVSQVIGRTVIIHSHPDDFTTQPSGDSGTKIACGLIERTGQQPRRGCAAVRPVC